MQYSLVNISRSIGLVALLLVMACGSDEKKESDHTELELMELNDEVKRSYAPDKRVAIYTVEISHEGNRVTLQGETDIPHALEEFREELQKRNYTVDDQVNRLPDASVGDLPMAVVNNSVANIRSRPGHSGELATQALLGTPLKVLKDEGDFYLIQTPDQYIAWVDHGGVERQSYDSFYSWMNSDKIIYLKPFGFVTKRPGDPLKIVGDLVLGSQLKLIGDPGDFFNVEYPDGRRGFIPKNEAMKLDEWLSDTHPDPELIELYARALTGSPYLWGGTSAKGMDCSGFTKTVYFMNGLIIPRDASQQVTAGRPVDPELTFEGLEKGDLMFFGRKETDSTAQKVTHVAIWLGNDRQEFIHASGRVRVNSIDPDAKNYDAFNKGRYLGSKRYLNVQDPKINRVSESGRLIDLVD